MDINEEEASRTEKESNATYFVRVACNWISKIDTWTKVNQRDREGEVPDYQSSIRRIFFLTRAQAMQNFVPPRLPSIYLIACIV